jgi:hypothetical protein
MIPEIIWANTMKVSDYGRGTVKNKSGIRKKRMDDSSSELHNLPGKSWQKYSQRNRKRSDQISI